jgi:hypothetical protein
MIQSYILLWKYATRKPANQTKYMKEMKYMKVA